MSAIIPAVALTALFVAIGHLVKIERAKHPEYVPAPIPDKPHAVSMDEVSKWLDGQQATATEKLDWRSGIVDLQKLLGNDASRAARREIWANFGLAGDYTGTAEQNVELHRLVMEEIANGGIKVPDAAAA